MSNNWPTLIVNTHESENDQQFWTVRVRTTIGILVDDPVLCYAVQVLTRSINSETAWNTHQTKILGDKVQAMEEAEKLFCQQLSNCERDHHDNLGTIGGMSSARPVPLRRQQSLSVLSRLIAAHHNSQPRRQSAIDLLKIQPRSMVVTDIVLTSVNDLTEELMSKLPRPWHLQPSFADGIRTLTHNGMLYPENPSVNVSPFAVSDVKHLLGCKRRILDGYYFPPVDVYVVNDYINIKSYNERYGDLLQMFGSTADKCSREYTDTTEQLMVMADYFDDTADIKEYMLNPKILSHVWLNSSVLCDTVKELHHQIQALLDQWVSCLSVNGVFIYDARSHYTQGLQSHRVWRILFSDKNSH